MVVCPELSRISRLNVVFEVVVAVPDKDTEAAVLAEGGFVCALDDVLVVLGLSDAPACLCIGAWGEG